MDLGKAKVLQYQLDGAFIEEHRFGFLTRRFGVLEENAFLFDQGTRKNVNVNVDFDYKLINLIPNSQQINKFIKYSEIYDSYIYPLPSTRSLYRSGDRLYYSRPYEYTIYQPISEIFDVKALIKDIEIDFIYEVD